MPKELSILELFKSVGFVLGEYDEDSDKIRRSFWAFVNSYTTLFFTVFVPFKMVYCWKRLGPEDRQLMLIYGDIFYYFAPDTKAFMAYAGLWSIVSISQTLESRLNCYSFLGAIVGTWIVVLHTTINFYLNSKREDLFLYFLKLIYEVKPKSGNYRKIVGFTRNSEDELFFQRAAQLNYKISEILRYFTYFGTVLVSRPYFNLEGTQLDFVTFWFFAAVNCWVFGFFFVKFLKIICGLSLYPVVILRYFSGRCKHIFDQIETLKAGSGIDNVKLEELLLEFNTLMLQMTNVNGYWKFLFGELRVSLGDLKFLLILIIFRYKLSGSIGACDCHGLFDPYRGRRFPDCGSKLFVNLLHPELLHRLSLQRRGGQANAPMQLSTAKHGVQLPGELVEQRENQFRILPTRRRAFGVYLFYLVWSFAILCDAGK